MPARFSWLLLALAFILPTAIHADEDAAVKRMRADLTFLSSDACEGRGPGTAGIDKAADYIAAAFKEAGLKPGMPEASYFQPFLVRGNPALGTAVGVTVTPPDAEPESLKLDEAFQAL